jgi:acetyl-CoA carboxylase biotin carboxyl carrier protein
MRPKADAAPRRAVRASKPAPVEPVVEPAGMDLALIRQLARLLNEEQLSELELERGGDRVRLRRGQDAVLVTAPPPPVAAAAAPLPPAAAPAPAAPAADANVIAVTSPFVGTFYRAPSPDAPPYVDAGARIHKGQVLCIVEAMKLMNEIESEVEGTILEILVANGQPVEYGEPLFRIKVG